MEQIYLNRGYIVFRGGGANPDGGIDLVIEKQGQKFAIQCKQWKAWKVGVKVIREFMGALKDAQIEKGIFITIRGYTDEARQLAEKHGIEILNKSDLIKMLDEVEPSANHHLAEILEDKRKFCPKCEQEMVLRTATKGINIGNQFWGCSAFPKCRFTMPR